MLMQIMIKDDRYRPNILKKAMMRHIASPACQDTVAAHAISSGIIKNVTCPKQHIKLNRTFVCFLFVKFKRNVSRNVSKFILFFSEFKIVHFFYFSYFFFFLHRFVTVNCRFKIIADCLVVVISFYLQGGQRSTSALRGWLSGTWISVSLLRSLSAQ